MIGPSKNIRPQNADNILFRVWLEFEMHLIVLFLQSFLKCLFVTATPTPHSTINSLSSHSHQHILHRDYTLHLSRLYPFTQKFKSCFHQKRVRHVYAISFFHIGTENFPSVVSISGHSPLIPCHLLFYVVSFPSVCYILLISL